MVRALVGDSTMTRVDIKAFWGRLGSEYKNRGGVSAGSIPAPIEPSLGILMILSSDRSRQLAGFKTEI